MGPTQSPRHFRVNPVELTIFSVVTLLFAYSIYHLFYDHQGFQTNILNNSAQISTISEGRNPASVASPLFLSAEIQCNEMTEQKTPASKVRLSGPICGSAAGESISEPKIENQTNKIAATVFLDQTTHKFSTDYLPLNPGKNLISISFPNAAKKKTVFLEVFRN